MQTPGRGTRGKEAPITVAAALAAQLLPIIASRLISVPYIVRSSFILSWSRTTECVAINLSDP